MLTPTDLDGPARLQYATAGQDTADPGGWSQAREFASLREALHLAMAEEAPPGKAPFIRAESGLVLGPAMLEGLWTSLQGP
jgi:hypothetical protein